MIRRQRQPLVGAVVAAVTAALTFAALSTAAAAQLGVTSSGLGAYSDEACTTQSVATTVGSTFSGPNYSSVEITDLPDACAGLPISLVVFDISGTSIASGTATAPAAPVPAFDVATSTYTGTDAAGVALLVDTWHVPTTWTSPTPPPPFSCVPINNGGNPTGSPCTVTIDSISHWISYPGAWGVGDPYNHYSINYSVSTNQNRWEVTFDFSHPYFNGGFTPTYIGSGYNVVRGNGYSCSSLPVFVAGKGVGNVSWGNNAVLYATNAPGSTNGTTQVCP